MDTQTQINNTVFANEIELKNWLYFMSFSTKDKEKKTKKYINRRKIYKKDIKRLEQLLIKIYETGFKTFKIKHLKGNTPKGSNIDDLLPEYNGRKISADIQKLVKYNILKVRYKGNHNRRARYEKNYENIDSAIKKVNDYAE